MQTSPFSQLLIAVALSPRAKANLAEAFRLSAYFQAQLTIVHVGILDTSGRTKLLGWIEELAIDGVKHQLVERTGEPVKEIIGACKEFQIDLLLAGALVKEGIWTYYVGSIARKLCRKATCSILLLTNPKVESESIHRMAVSGVNHPKTPTTLGVAAQVGNLLGARELVVVQEIASKRVAHAEDDRSMHLGTSQFQSICEKEKERIQTILAPMPSAWKDHLTIETRCLMGESGYTIGHYCALEQVDLLVLNSPDTRLKWFDRVFTHDLEYLLNELPCDLLLVHSTKRSNA